VPATGAKAAAKSRAAVLRLPSWEKARSSPPDWGKFGRKGTSTAGNPMAKNAFRFVRRAVPKGLSE